MVGAASSWYSLIATVANNEKVNSWKIMNFPRKEFSAKFSLQHKGTISCNKNSSIATPVVRPWARIFGLIDAGLLATANEALKKSYEFSRFSMEKWKAKRSTKK